MRRRWKYDQADWTAFENTIKNLLSPDIQHSLDKIAESIIAAAEQSIPLSSGKPGRKSMPWWNKETHEAVKIRRKALRRFHRLPENSEEKHEAPKVFQTARASSRKVISEAKKNSWIEFIAGINPQLNTTELWKRIDILSGKRRTQGHTLKIGNNIIENPAEIAEHLADHFAQISSSDNYSNNFLQKKTQLENAALIPESGRDHVYNNNFSIDELMRAIDVAKGNSAGPDNIGYPMIKRLPFHAKITLLEAFNKCWATDSFPNHWRESLVIPIPKQKETGSLNNYRPISLINCLAKTFERMVNKRLISMLEDRNLLDARQHAFRKGKGTGSYFCCLDDHIETIVSKNYHGEFALLDLEKAYDRTWKRNIINTLNAWGIEGSMLSFICYFLGNRSFRVSIGGNTSEARNQENGVPQGSVLSVTLFLIAMEPLFAHIPTNVDVLLYADDILVISKSLSREAVRKQLQQGVNAVVKWAHSVGFSISGEKSRLLHCCNLQRHKGKRKPLTISDQTVKQVNCARILGVQLDNKLSFEKHIASSKKDATSRLRILKIIGERSKICNRRTITTVGKALVLSKLTYGIELFSRAKWSTIEKMAPNYNSIVRYASGAYCTSPIQSLLAEAGELPFRHVLVKCLTHRAVKHKEKNSNSTATITRANEWLKNLTNFELPNIATLPRIGERRWNDPDPVIDWTIKQTLRAGENKNKVLPVFHHLLHTRYNNHHHIYTDGSVAGGQVGIGIFSSNNEEFIQLPQLLSIFSAEATALHRAAASINLNDNMKTVIFTDSASVLSALEGGKSNHPYVQNLEKQAANQQITFCWIPAHCGISGNEKADQLANTGRQATLLNLNVPSQDIFRHINNPLRQEWEGAWLNNTHAFLRRIKNSTIPWADNRNRCYQRCLTRLRIGHTRLTHGYRLDRTEPPTCRTCNENLSVEHIILTCRKYSVYRKILRINSNIRTALARDEEEENKLIVFLQETELLDLI